MKNDEVVTSGALAAIRANAEKIKAANAVADKVLLDGIVSEVSKVRDEVEAATVDAVNDEKNAEKIIDAAIGKVYRYCRSHSCPCGLGSGGCRFVGHNGSTNDVVKADDLSCGLSVCDFADVVTRVKRDAEYMADTVKDGQCVVGSIEYKISENRRLVLNDLERRLAEAKEALIRHERECAETEKKLEELDDRFGFNG